ncbi:MAG: UDP-N-acetylmuramate dehydrogenase [Thermodesulfobacteriota bacterium]
MNAEKKSSMQYSLFFIQRFKGKVLFNVPMSRYTSLKVGGPADVMAFPQDAGDLKDLISFAGSKGFPYFILGAGTNLMVRDGGWRGIVVNMCDGFKDITWQEDSKVVMGAGVRLVEALSRCVDKGLAGLEFAAGIPGTMGGAVVMNAGAFGSEMKDIVEGVEVVDKKGRKGFIPKDEIGFSYRGSALAPDAVVVRVHLKLAPGDAQGIKDKIKFYRERRRTISNVTFPNAGSMFKNPEDNFAGKLIDEAGLKGERSGDAQVSQVHANYIVNLGNAKAKDVLALMATVRDRVYSRTGVVLEPEIRVIGED